MFVGVYPYKISVSDILRYGNSNRGFESHPLCFVTPFLLNGFNQTGWKKEGS